MGVDRIIFLLAVIRVIKNDAAPYASGGTTCSGLTEKCLFELHSAANETDLLANVVESTRPAIVRRSEIGEGSVKDISSESFAEYKGKSQASKVCRSHSSQCVDHKTNMSRSTSAWTELNGTTNENPFQKNTTRLALKTTKEFDEKMYNTSDDCGTEINKNVTKVFPSNVVVKSLKATAPLSTLFADSSSSRVFRALKMTAKQPQKEALEGKSEKTLTTRKFLQAKIYRNPNNMAAKREKSARKNMKTERKKSARKNMNVDAAIKKINSIPIRTIWRQEPWNKLMAIAAKSLTKTKAGEKIKSRSSSPSKLLFSAKGDSIVKASTRRKMSSKQVKRPGAKSARKSAAKTSASVASNTKSSSTRNRASQERTFVSTLRKRIKSSSALTPGNRKMIAAKNYKGNRGTRELKVSINPGGKCSPDNSRQTKRSVGPHVKRDLTVHAPMACTVIKISHSCDDDCSDDNKDFLPETDEIDVEDNLGQLLPDEQPELEELIDSESEENEEVSENYEDGPEFPANPTDEGGPKEGEEGNEEDYDEEGNGENGVEGPAKPDAAEEETNPEEMLPQTEGEGNDENENDETIDEIYD